MIQACPDGWFSLGIHIDPRRRFAANAKEWFGPYIDIHLACVIVSLGFNPVRSGVIEGHIGIGRGGYQDE